MSHIKSEPACGNLNNFYSFLTDDFESSVEIAQLGKFSMEIETFLAYVCVSPS